MFTMTKPFIDWIPLTKDSKPDKSGDYLVCTTYPDYESDDGLTQSEYSIAMWRTAGEFIDCARSEAVKGITSDMDDVTKLMYSLFSGDVKVKEDGFYQNFAPLSDEDYKSHPGYWEFPELVGTPDDGRTFWAPLPVAPKGCIAPDDYEKKTDNSIKTDPKYRIDVPFVSIDWDATEGVESECERNARIIAQKAQDYFKSGRYHEDLIPVSVFSGIITDTKDPIVMKNEILAAAKAVYECGLKKDVTVSHTGYLVAHAPMYQTNNILFSLYARDVKYGEFKDIKDLYKDTVLLLRWLLANGIPYLPLSLEFALEMIYRNTWSFDIYNANCSDDGWYGKTLKRYRKIFGFDK